MTAIWKIRSELIRALTLRDWGQKRFFGTDFKLWPNMSLKWNITSTIRKKLVNIRKLPYMTPKCGELWPKTAENGWRVFARPPKYSHWETLPAIPHGRYNIITDSRQTLARVRYWHELTVYNNWMPVGLTLGFAMHLLISTVIINNYYNCHTNTHIIIIAVM